MSITFNTIQLAKDFEEYHKKEQMKPIMEAREFKRRLDKAMDALANSSDESNILIDTYLFDEWRQLCSLLFMIRQGLEIRIDEWDAEKGIDKPL
jgi:hypothetical protein